MTKERNTSRPERALSARSLIASLLLRSEPRRMRGARLVQWCGLFGVSEGTARVALSRMVDRGELRTVDGFYELAGRVGARRITQDWSLAPARAAWDGQWRMAVVVDGSRAAADRGNLRDAMRHLRYAELREGVWGRPDNLPRESGPSDAWKVAEAQCEWWGAVPDRDDPAWVEARFDARRWTTSARACARKLDGAARALDPSRDRSLAAAFMAGTRALTIIRADPLLPATIGTSAAAGDDLRAAYSDYEAAFGLAVRGWFQSQ